MAYVLTGADKNRPEILVADGAWHGLVINGRDRWDYLGHGDQAFELDLFGDVPWDFDRAFKGLPQLEACLWLVMARYTKPGQAITAANLTGHRGPIFIRARGPKRTNWAAGIGKLLTTQVGVEYGFGYKIEGGDSPIVILENRVPTGGVTKVSA